MAAEVKLTPGWLIKDARRASERLDQWSANTPHVQSNDHYVANAITTEGFARKPNDAESKKCF